MVTQGKIVMGEDSEDDMMEEDMFEDEDVIYEYEEDDEDTEVVYVDENGDEIAVLLEDHVPIDDIETTDTHIERQNEALLGLSSPTANEAKNHAPSAEDSTGSSLFSNDSSPSISTTTTLSSEPSKPRLVMRLDTHRDKLNKSNRALYDLRVKLCKNKLKSNCTKLSDVRDNLVKATSLLNKGKIVTNRFIEHDIDFEKPEFSWLTKMKFDTEKKDSSEPENSTNQDQVPVPE